MISASKAISHFVLARKWGNGFMMRPDMRMKRGETSWESEYSGGLCECEARNNPGISF